MQTTMTWRGLEIEKDTTAAPSWTCRRAGQIVGTADTRDGIMEIAWREANRIATEKDETLTA